MEAFLISTGVVALGEIGDKTQLLSLLLAARFRKPAPIIAGIFVATVVNHFLAGWAGTLVAHWLGPQAMRWVLGVSFIAMAAWIMVPDKLDDDDAKFNDSLGVFGATVLAFFLAEMGDKTQIATVALAAKFQSLVAVVSGTTLGMLLADVPAVFIGDAMSKKLPLKLVHGIAALLFALLGAVVLFGVDTSLFGG